MTTKPEYMTEAEVLAYHDITPRCLRRWLDNGTLPAPAIAGRKGPRVIRLWRTTAVEAVPDALAQRARMRRTHVAASSGRSPGDEAQSMAMCARWLDLSRRLNRVVRAGR